MTPEKAGKCGCDYIVVGRPITQAEDVVAAYRRAEQAERNARERAAAFYQKIDDLVAKTNDQLSQDDKSLGALAGELGANIAALQQVMVKIRATLDDFTGTSCSETFALIFFLKRFQLHVQVLWHTIS